MENTYPAYVPQVTYSEPVATSFHQYNQRQPITTNPFIAVNTTSDSYPVNQSSYGNIAILDGFLGSANIFNLEYKKGGTYRSMIITNADVNNPFYDPLSAMKCEPEFHETDFCFCKGICTDPYLLSMSIVYATNVERPVPTQTDAEQGGNLIFSFKPHFWLTPTKEEKRIVEIFHDGLERERLGHIEASKDVTESAQIVNSLTKEQFSTRKIENLDSKDLQVNIVDSGGNVVAWGKLLKEEGFVEKTPSQFVPMLEGLIHYPKFQFFFSPEFVPISSTSRAIILVTLIFWVLDTQERLKRKGVMVMAAGILFLLILIGIIF